MYIIYIKDVLKNIHKNIQTDKICTKFSMNKQYVKGVQKRGKSCLRLMDNKMVITISVLHFKAKENICTV